MSGAAPGERLLPGLAPRLEIHQGDNLPILEGLTASSFQLIYIDPPFNTGIRQQRVRLSTVQDPDGERTGFGGRRYKSTALSVSGVAPIVTPMLVPELLKALPTLPAGTGFAVS